MAHMIPPEPKDFDKKSDEGVVFEALKKLSDDYYVFHSVVVNDVVNHDLVEREIDFVVVNQHYGVLCIEAKNGNDIRYYDRAWRYTSGEKMKRGGPYNQAATAKRALKNKMRYHANDVVRSVAGRCKMFHAAWFFKMTRNAFKLKNAEGLPEDALFELTMFADDVVDPTTAIENIFKLNIPINEDLDVVTKINDEEFQLLLDVVFCPEFNLIPSPSAKNMLIEDSMNQLLYEQYRLLDFLEDQESAVINGAAGTGKTMLAVEKARRNSMEEEPVLFLCYNRLLCDHLNSVHKKNASKSYRKQFENVDFMTISQLAKEKTGNYKDFDGLMEWLMECCDDPDKFGYKHVIVDEGQDFGLVDASVDSSEAEANCSILDLLQDAAAESNGTFYLFYDKYQMIQGGESIEYKIPDCITNSDCKLSLHLNCRNTKEIAQTSVTPLKDSKNRAIKPKAACTWYEPAKPQMHIIGSKKKAISTINEILDKYYENKLEKVVILTPGKEEFSCLSDSLAQGSGDNEGYMTYSHNGIDYKVTTCIKFKGLEADAIIMMDLDKSSFTGYKGLEFYVGTSRAKQYLDYVVCLTPNDFPEVIAALDPDAPIKNDPEKLRKVLGTLFASDLVIH